MATPWRTEYPILGGLIFGSKGIDCYDWDDLLGTADKKGDPGWDIPGTDGVEGLDQFEDGHRALLLVKIEGRWTQDNVAVAGAAARRTQLHNHLAAVRAVCTVGTTQTLTLVRAGFANTSVDAKVVSPFRPRHEDVDIYKGSIDLLLPDGTML